MMEALGASKAAESAEQLLALHDEEFVRCAYVTVLGRQADQGGFANYLDQIRRGADKEKILLALATSPEGRKVDTLRLPGLKEIVDASQRNRSSLLSRALARLLSGALRPMFARLNGVEYRIDKLNELVQRRLGYVDAAASQEEVRAAGFIAQLNGVEYRIDKLNELMQRRLGDVDAAASQEGVRAAGFITHPLQPVGAQKVGGNSPVRAEETTGTNRWPIYAQRSRLDRRRMNLERAFGRETVTDRFFYAIVSAVRLVAESKSAVGQFMEDAIVARWILTGPASDQTFSDLSTQLSALYYSAFMCSQVRRTTAEMDTCNSVAARALVAEIWPTSYSDLPITAFMLCVIGAHYAEMPDFQNPSKRDRICAEFFLRLVPKYGLERYVTSAQRNALCRSASGAWEGKVSLLQSWLLETDDNLRNRFTPLDAPALAAFLTWFGDVGLWEMGLDFCLREEDLRACQMTLAPTTGGSDLVIPAYFSAKGLLPDDMGLAETETWLHEMVWIRRYDADFPWRVFAPSIFAYVSNGQPPEPYEPRASANFVCGLGVRQLRPGDLLVFCDGGNGLRHLIGRGWSWPETAHVWSVAQTALLAINLDAADDGPLDLVLEFHAQPDARVTVVWNGRIVDLVRPKPGGDTVLTCSLGQHHQTGGASNILSLCIDRLFSPSESGGSDNRTLGLALCTLALVQR